MVIGLASLTFHTVAIVHLYDRQDPGDCEVKSWYVLLQAAVSIKEAALAAGANPDEAAVAAGEVTGGGLTEMAP